MPQCCGACLDECLHGSKRGLRSAREYIDDTPRPIESAQARAALFFECQQTHAQSLRQALSLSERDSKSNAPNMHRSFRKNVNAGWPRWANGLYITRETHMVYAARPSAA